MEKINFEDLPSTETPIDSKNLNLLQTNIENAINGVVESGSNTNGDYIKFLDGTLICNKTLYVEALGGKLWANNIYYSETEVGNFAQTFINPPICQVSCSAPQYWVNISGTRFNKTVRAYRPNEGTSSGYLYVTAIGRWK